MYHSRDMAQGATSKSLDGSSNEAAGQDGMPDYRPFLAP